MNQNYDPNFCYNPIYSGFDQHQPTQFPEIHYPPQATDTEMLQARENLTEMLQARENLMETIQAFLKEYDHIPPEEKCMALLLAEERFLKIKQAVEEEQNQPEVMQELLLKLMNDLQILKGIQPKQAEQEEQAAKSFTSYGNFSMIDDDVKMLQDRENLMKDIQTFLRKFSRIHFGEIPKVLLIAWERFSEIKHAFTDKQYQQEDIQELMSKLLEDVRNINEELSEFINSPSWNRPTFYNDDDEYTIIYRKHKEITPDLPTEEPDNSLNDFDEEEGEIDIDIFQIEDEILCEKLLNVNLLIDKIEALNLTPSIPLVLKYPSSSPIPVVDSEFLIEEVDTFLVPEDSIPPSIESDLDSEGDIVFLDNLLNEDPIPEYEHFTFDIEPDAPVINNFDELNKDECFEPRGGEIVVSQNVEDDDSFAFVIQTFLPYRTYPVDSPLLLSTGSEDTIFNPCISS
ncbi:hypothetical protein Tco_1033339 [Tanacetum coccineum]|uniref:Uncharacterized protein n=1 Tax=Tanacetum coccineum TaxID=301880 RepID=A0ABQ5GED2_9ASTR